MYPFSMNLPKVDFEIPVQTRDMAQFAVRRGEESLRSNCR